MLVVASIVWGLLLSSRYLAGGPKPKGLLDLHRFLGGLSVVFTMLHVVGLYLDSYVKFTIRDLLIPFAADWKPADFGTASRPGPTLRPAGTGPAAGPPSVSWSG